MTSPPPRTSATGTPIPAIWASRESAEDPMKAVMTPTTATAPPSIDQPARWVSGERRNHPRWTTSSYMSPRTRASAASVTVPVQPLAASSRVAITLATSCAPATTTDSQFEEYTAVPSGAR